MARSHRHVAQFLNRGVQFAAPADYKKGLDQIVEILYLLIPVSIALVFVIGGIFWWALNNQQFDGLDEEASRIFLEDDLPAPKAATTASTDAPAAKNPAQ